MKKLEINYVFDGVNYTHTAVIDEKFHIVECEENEATDIVTGIADELGIWSLNFGSIEVDFEAIINNGEEICTFEPVEVWLWGKRGINYTIPFTVKVS